MSDDRDWYIGEPPPESDEVREEREWTEQEVQLAEQAIKEIEERSRRWGAGHQAFIAGVMKAAHDAIFDRAYGRNQ